MKFSNFKDTRCIVALIQNANTILNVIDVTTSLVPSTSILCITSIYQHKISSAFILDWCVVVRIENSFKGDFTFFELIPSTLANQVKWLLLSEV